MTFTSPVFPLFFLAVLLGLRLLPPAKKWMLLLPASWFFYAWHSPPLLGLLVLATGISYGCGRGMEQCQTKKARKRLLLLGSMALLGMLFLFKYLDFAVGSVLSLTGHSFRGFGLVLPMGISFYIFQTLSYLIDVYRGDIAAERNIAIYALFVSFFPQLVAGPIERTGNLLPQLRSPKAPDENMTAEGTRLLLVGYFKKVVIADMAAACVDTAYSCPEAAGGLALLAATALFGLQIYCDFSGYTDIARGCALLMGIRLSENFRRPYAAVTLREFWQRWHMSLTRWFTDYVYIPLGGSRRGLTVTLRNTMIVFLLSGLWHGADVTFLIWGGLHGLFLCAERLVGEKAPRHPRLRHFFTLLLVGFAWIFFRADSLADALLILKVMVCSPAPGQFWSGLGLSAASALLLIGVLPLLPLVERLPTLSADGNGNLKALLLILVIFFCRLILLSAGHTGAFIYFQF